MEQLHGCFERVGIIIREDARAPVPHLCLQFAAANQIYTTIARAATVSRYEPIVQSAVDAFVALVDSEEEEFLSSAPFAKSLMRLVTKVVDGGTVLVSIETETAILELLFTIAAKIRLQPEILVYWFQSTAKPELEDVFVKEKKSFVGITQKDDFPLCYLLIDRVHHEGRIGDFARTGLLYIFEATGRSEDLEEWVCSSDLATLMASGLGALYSQLSRELSILHPDATLPAVLAMSDYTTTHPRATAESAFSERHQSHMATFLSYLAFWQDVLDHCKSADVKQTLLDHFQILFLQQLLYPSLLQSSDTDAGSSVAVLTYLTAMIESLQYPDLMNMMLAYLLAIQNDSPSVPDTPITPSKAPRSPTTLRRRQSLMLLTAPKDPDDAVEPTLFNLVDLTLNNVSSRNSQSVFAALKFSSTILIRQKELAFGTLLKLQRSRRSEFGRNVGAFELELKRLTELATSLHEHLGLDDAYAGLVEDVRLAIESQVPFKPPTIQQASDSYEKLAGLYILASDDPFLKALSALLRSFFTNSIDVNLALTQTIISIAVCIEIRLDSWLTMDPSSYSFADESSGPQKLWHAHLDDDEKVALFALQQASRCPNWLADNTPLLSRTLQALAQELGVVRGIVPNFDTLISGRKNMLHAASLPTPLTSSDPPPLMSSPTQPTYLDVTKPPNSQSRSSSKSSLVAGRTKANDIGPPHSGNSAASPAPWHQDGTNISGSLPMPPTKLVLLPLPPETPSTTDVLMEAIKFPAIQSGEDHVTDLHGSGERKASLNHVLTNVVVLQEFVLELVAVLQVRAAVLGEEEVKLT